MGLDKRIYVFRCDDPTYKPSQVTLYGNVLLDWWWLAPTAWQAHNLGITSPLLGYCTEVAEILLWEIQLMISRSTKLYIVTFSPARGLSVITFFTLCLGGVMPLLITLINFIYHRQISM